MASKRLRAVQSGEQSPEPRKPQTVAEAAESGDTLATLVAMRDRISKAVSSPDCPPRDLAALTRRLQEIIKDIDAKLAQNRQESERRGGHGGAADGSFDASAI